MTTRRWPRRLGTATLAVFCCAAPGISKAQVAVLSWACVGDSDDPHAVRCETEKDLLDEVAKAVAANPGVELCLTIRVQREISPDCITRMSRRHPTIARLKFIGEGVTEAHIDELRKTRRRSRMRVLECGMRPVPSTAPAPSGLLLGPASEPVRLLGPAPPPPCPYQFLQPQPVSCLWSAGLALSQLMLLLRGCGPSQAPLPLQASFPLPGPASLPELSLQLPAALQLSDLQGPTVLRPDDIPPESESRGPDRPGSAFKRFKRK